MSRCSLVRHPVIGLERFFTTIGFNFARFFIFYTFNASFSMAQNQKGTSEQQLAVGNVVCVQHMAQHILFGIPFSLTTFVTRHTKP